MRGSWAVFHFLCGVASRFFCTSKPLDGFTMVLRNAPAVTVHVSEVVLCSGVALFGGASKPLDGFPIVLWNRPFLSITPRLDCAPA